MKSRISKLIVACLIVNMLSFCSVFAETGELGGGTGTDPVYSTGGETTIYPVMTLMAATTGKWYDQYVNDGYRLMEVGELTKSVTGVYVSINADTFKGGLKLVLPSTDASGAPIQYGDSIFFNANGESTTGNTPNLGGASMVIPGQSISSSTCKIWANHIKNLRIDNPKNSASVTIIMSDSLESLTMGDNGNVNYYTVDINNAPLLKEVINENSSNKMRLMCNNTPLMDIRNCNLSGLSALCIVGANPLDNATFKWPNNVGISGSTQFPSLERGIAIGTIDATEYVPKFTTSTPYTT